MVSRRRFLKGLGGVLGLGVLGKFGLPEVPVVAAPKEAAAYPVFDGEWTMRK